MILTKAIIDKAWKRHIEVLHDRCGGEQEVPIRIAIALSAAMEAALESDLPDIERTLASKAPLLSTDRMKGDQA